MWDYISTFQGLQVNLTTLKFVWRLETPQSIVLHPYMCVSFYECIAMTTFIITSCQSFGSLEKRTTKLYWITLIVLPIEPACTRGGHSIQQGHSSKLKQVLQSPDNGRNLSKRKVQIVYSEGVQHKCTCIIDSKITNALVSFYLAQMWIATQEICACLFRVHQISSHHMSSWLMKHRTISQLFLPLEELMA